ncbi:MAG: TadE/TadG family type IV pilus assembly protein [Chloroflexota bacterium]
MKKRNFPRFLRSQGALETAEAAITLPLVLLVMLAIFNLGMVVYGQQAVQQAARHGARMGSVAQQCGACYAASAANGAIANDPVVKNAGVSILAPGGVAGSILTVQVTGEIPNFIGGLLPGAPGAFKVSSSATFRQEGW